MKRRERQAIAIEPCPVCGEHQKIYKTPDSWQCGCGAFLMSYKMGGEVLIGEIRVHKEGDQDEARV